MAYPNTHETAVGLISRESKASRILDVGCGRGEIVMMLRKIGFKHVQYCDGSDRFDGKVKVMDFNKGLSYADHSFDIVISTEVINCVKDPDFFLREIQRVLKKEGILVLSFPNLQNMLNRLYRLFTGRYWDTVKGVFGPYFIRQLPDFVKVERLTYNRGFIPLIRVPFIKGRMFGQTVILRCSFR